MGGQTLPPLKKAAIFLLLIGADKGQKVIALMDTGEIKAVAAEIGKLAGLSPELGRCILAEFAALGYSGDMTAFETLGIIRRLFDGRA
jgi:flagellar motor switch protein FliG